MKIRSKSLLLRLITPLSLLSVVMVLTISVSTYFSARETLKQSLYDRLSVAAILKEEELNQWFQSHRNDILLLARSLEVQSQTKLLLANAEPSPEESEDQPEAPLDSDIKQVARNNLETYLRNVVTFKPDLAEISIVGDDELILFSTNKQLENTSQSLDINTTYFADGSDEIAPVPYTSPTTGATAITLATPILDTAKTRIGVLLVTLDLQDIDALIQERTGLGKTGTTYLVGQIEQQNSFIASDKDSDVA